MPVLRMRRLGFTEVTRCTQGCAGSKWQGGDHHPDLLAPRTLTRVAPNGLEGSEVEQLRLLGTDGHFRSFSLAASLRREARRRPWEADKWTRRRQSPLSEASWV